MMIVFSLGVVGLALLPVVAHEVKNRQVLRTMSVSDLNACVQSLADMGIEYSPYSRELDRRLKGSA